VPRPEKMIDYKRRHDRFSSTRNAGTEEGRILRCYPILEFCVIKKPLSGASIMAIDVVSVLFMVVYSAYPFNQASLALCSDISVKSRRIALDIESGIHNSTRVQLQIGDNSLDYLKIVFDCM
jgi:hypothetical protein